MAIFIHKLVLSDFFMIFSRTQDEPKRFQSAAFFGFVFQSLFRVSVYLNSHPAGIFWLSVSF